MRRFAVVAAAVAVAALAPAFAVTLGGGGDPRKLDRSAKYDFASDPAANSATYIASQADGKLKGLKRIAITNMCVQFVSTKSASGVAGSPTRVYTRTAEGGIPGGLDAVKMQAIADAWLVEIEAELRAAGYEIVPYEELAANDLFKKYSAKYDQGVRIGERSDGNNLRGNTAESVVYVSPLGRPFATDCGTISPASTGTFVRMAYPMNAEFLTISAVVDMGVAKASGGLLRGARADVDYVQHLRAGDTQFQFIGKMGPGARVWLKQSIVPPQDPFQVSADAKSNFELESMTSTTTQSVSFDAELYYRNAADALRAMHRMAVAFMSSKR